MYPTLSQIDLGKFFARSDVKLTLILFLVIFIICFIYGTVCRWFMFKKAGTKGVYSIVPFYRMAVLAKVAGYKGSAAIWWYVPIAGIFYTLMYKYNVSVRFGYGIKMAILYVFLPSVALSFFAFKGKYHQLEGDPEIVKKETKFEDIDVDPFKDFKPEMNENAVPFEETAVAYTEEDGIEIDPSKVELNLIDSDLVEEKKADYDDIPDPTPEQLIRPNLRKVEFETEVEAYEKPLSNQEKFYMAKAQAEKEQQEQLMKFAQVEEINPEVVNIPNGMEIDDMQYMGGQNSVLAGIQMNPNMVRQEDKRED